MNITEKKQSLLPALIVQEGNFLWKEKETSCICSQHISRGTWKQAKTADDIFEIALLSSQSFLNA